MEDERGGLGPLAAGVLIATDFWLPAAGTAVIAVGLLHGFANGDGMAQAGTGLWGIVGIAGTVFVVTALAAGCATAWQSGWLRVGWRVAGSWIGASGLLLLGWSLR